MMRRTALLQRTALTLILGLASLASAAAEEAASVPSALAPNAAPDLNACVDMFAKPGGATLRFETLTRSKTLSITFDRQAKTLRVRSTWSRDYWGTNFNSALSYGTSTLSRVDSWVGNYSLICDKAASESPCYYNLADIHNELSQYRARIPDSDASGHAALDCADRLADQFSREARSRLVRPFGDSTVAQDAQGKQVPADDGLLQPAQRRRTFVTVPR